MTDQEKNQPSLTFLAGLFLGALAGAAAVFLFGTQTGKKLKKKLEKQAKELLDELSQTAQKTEKKISKTVKQETRLLSQKIAAQRRRFFTRAGRPLR